MDPWECHQEAWLQTKKVLDHYQEVVSSDTEGQAKVKLLCGADLLESFATPGLWAPQDVWSLWNKITILICCEKRDHFGYETKSIFIMAISNSTNVAISVLVSVNIHKHFYYDIYRADYSTLQSYYYVYNKLHIYCKTSGPISHSWSHYYTKITFICVYEREVTGNHSTRAKNLPFSAIFYDNLCISMQGTHKIVQKKH